MHRMEVGLWEKPILLRAMQMNLNVQIQVSGAPFEGCQEEVNFMSVLQFPSVNSAVERGCRYVFAIAKAKAIT